MSYFEDTAHGGGFTQSQRTAWRENYNGGRAAGDVSGNINRNISELKALGASSPTRVLLRDEGTGVMVVAGGNAPARAVRAGGPPRSGGTGPGNGKVRTGGNVGSGPGAGSVLPPPGAGPRIVGQKDPSAVPRLFFGGSEFFMDPNTSGMADIEDALGEGDFLSPGWFANWAAAGHHVAYDLVQHTGFKPVKAGADLGAWWDQRGGPDYERNKAIISAPRRPSGWGTGGGF